MHCVGVWWLRIPVRGNSLKNEKDAGEDLYGCRSIEMIVLCWRKNMADMGTYTDLPKWTPGLRFQNVAG